MSQRTLLVLAAGMGSRYGGLKQIDPMGPSGETLLDYSVFDATRTGFDRVVFLIRRDIEAEFRGKVGARYEGRLAVDYIFQDLDHLPGTITAPPGRTKPWGTAHAIWCAREAIREPFAAINADDFYGTQTYTEIGKFLDGNPADTPRFAMAGFRLDRTLSEHGSVARGVCEVDASRRLTSIVEFTAIQRVNGEIFQEDGGGGRHVFRGDEPVSLNFWGLTPAVFPLLEVHLVEFLEQNRNDPKAEFYIPTAIGRMVSEHQATLDVIPTDSEWFGVTYREDKPRVSKSLARLHRDGVYPTPLWP